LQVALSSSESRQLVPSRQRQGVSEQKGLGLQKQTAQMGAFLKELAIGTEEAAAPPGPSGTIRVAINTTEQPGDKIGRYKLLDRTHPPLVRAFVGGDQGCRRGGRDGPKLNPVSVPRKFYGATDAQRIKCPS
jgi:hypothetical protein